MLRSLFSFYQKWPYHFWWRRRRRRGFWNFKLRFLNTCFRLFLFKFLLFFLLFLVIFLIFVCHLLCVFCLELFWQGYLLLMNLRKLLLSLLFLLFELRLKLLLFFSRVGYFYLLCFFYFFYNFCLGLFLLFCRRSWCLNHLILVF